jgi:dolichol-phosphate mannosyltransferase
MKNKLSVILPTYNERDNIIPLVDAIITSVYPSEILVVDDNSPDKTAESVREYIKEHNYVSLIVNEKRLGLAQSIRKGVLNSKNDIVVWMDSDLSHPPELLKKMLGEIKNFDAVIGSWLITGGGDKRKSILEKTRSFLANKICQLVFGNKITAYTSGYMMIRKSVLKNYEFGGDYGEYFIDLCRFLTKNDFRIREIPFICRSRRNGISKTSPNLVTLIKQSVKYIVMIGKIFILDL